MYYYNYIKSRLSSLQEGVTASSRVAYSPERYRDEEGGDGDAPPPGGEEEDGPKL